jgi:hypothetical protein
LSLDASTVARWDTITGTHRETVFGGP